MFKYKIIYEKIRHFVEMHLTNKRKKGGKTSLGVV